MEALSLAALGHPDRARQRCLEGIREAKSLGHPPTLAWVLQWSAAVHLVLRDVEGCRARGDELLRVSADMGFPQSLAFGKALVGWSRAWGRHDRGGLDQIREGIAEVMKLGSGGVGTPLALCVLSEALLALGQKEEALGAAEGGLAHSREKGNHVVDAELHRVRGEGLLLLDRTEQAEAELLRSIEVAQRQEAKSLELRAATSLARLWQRQGKRAEARDLLQPVYDWFTEGFDTRDLKDAKALLAELA